MPTQIYDDGYYYELSQAENLLSEANQLRTYGYPLFLFVIENVLNYLNLDYLFFNTIFFIQTSFYIISIACISLIATKKSRLLIFFTLSLNIFIAPYHSLTLTDSVYVSLTIVIITFLIRLFDNYYISNLYIFLIVLSFSVSFVVRPASIWLLPLIVVAFVSIYKKVHDYKNFLVVSIIGIIPIFFQSYLNKITFNTFSPFPVADLGAKQIGYGIQNIKYATWVGESKGPIFYSSKNLVQFSPDNLDLVWYINNPYDGIKLLLVKLIGAFDFDLILPYSVSSQGIQKYLGLFTLSVFLIGCTIMVLNLWVKINGIGPNWFPLTVFLSWSSVNLLSAVELRFSLPMLSFLTFITVVGLKHLYKEKLNYFNFLLPVWGILLVLIIYIADFVRDQRLIP